MRLDMQEKKALKVALQDFKGRVYLFGSRTDEKKKGGDIDILLIPKKKSNPVELALKVQTRFFSLCEEKIDVIVYDGGIFCKEILRHAERVDIKRV